MRWKNVAVSGRYDNQGTRTLGIAITFVHRNTLTGPVLHYFILRLPGSYPLLPDSLGNRKHFNANQTASKLPQKQNSRFALVYF